MSDKPTPNVNLHPKFGYSGLAVENDPPNFSPGPCTPRLQWPHATLPPAGFLYTEEEALFHFWCLRQFDLDYSAFDDIDPTPITGSLEARPALYPTDDLPRERVCLASGTSATSGGGSGARFNLAPHALNRIFRGVPIVEFFDGTTSLGWGFCAGAVGLDTAITGLNLALEAGGSCIVILGVQGDEVFPPGLIPVAITYARLQLTASTWLQVTVGQSAFPNDVTVTGSGTSQINVNVDLDGGTEEIDFTITASNAQIYTGPP